MGVVLREGTEGESARGKEEEEEKEEDGKGAIDWRGENSERAITIECVKRQ